MCYPMKLSASQAAKETGKSIPTITRAIKSGKLSAQKTETGGFEIDPAELFRVFDRVTETANDTPTKLGHETPNGNEALQAKLEAKDEQIVLLLSERDDLRRRLDQEAEERRKLTALLTYQSENPVSAPAVAADKRKPSWWPFGRANH